MKKSSQCNIPKDIAAILNRIEDMMISHDLENRIIGGAEIYEELSRVNKLYNTYNINYDTTR